MTITDPLNVPEDGNRGDTFFDDLEAAVTRINDHIHDGDDSEQIKQSDIIQGTDAESLSFYIDKEITESAGVAYVFNLTTEGFTNVDVRTAQLELRDADDDFLIVTAEFKVKAIAADQVQIVTALALTAHNFRLIVRG